MRLSELLAATPDAYREEAIEDLIDCGALFYDAITRCKFLSHSNAVMTRYSKSAMQVKSLRRELTLERLPTT